jgi:hypothetical protein
MSRVRSPNRVTGDKSKLADPGKLCSAPAAMKRVISWLPIWHSCTPRPTLDQQTPRSTRPIPRLRVRARPAATAHPTGHHRAQTGRERSPHLEQYRSAQLEWIKRHRFINVLQLHCFASSYVSTRSINPHLQNISEMRVLEVRQVRSVSVLLIGLVTEGRLHFISLLIAVHEQHPQSDG